MAEKFSGEQIEEYKECFSLFDRDHDGFINREELEVILRSLGQNATYVEINKMINNVGKPKLSFPEFLKCLAEFMSQNVDTEREILDAFELTDRNKKGHISRAQFHKALTSTGEYLPDAEALQMLKDTGNDRYPNINYKQLTRQVVHGK